MIAGRISRACCIVILTCAGACGRGGTVGTERLAASRSQQPSTLEGIGRLDQQSFNSSLPRLRQLLEQTDPSIWTGDATRSAITQKLRQTPESVPEYWPTMLRFLEFASANMALKAPTNEPHKKLSEILSVGIMRGVREYDQIIVFDQGYLENGEFTNCRIVFTPQPVQMRGVSFKVCAFEFPATDAPNLYLKKLARILLASDLTSVAIANL